MAPICVGLYGAKGQKMVTMNNPPELRSLYVDPSEMEWCTSEFPGIQHKVLWSDPESGRSTILFKLEPGAVVPHHEHADIEQTWVISGTFEDHEGKALPGHYIWRPAGNRHEARSVDGAVILGSNVSMCVGPPWTVGLITRSYPCRREYLSFVLPLVDF